MSVPVIDLKQFPYPTYAVPLGRAFEDIGFAVLTNHGISPALIERAYGTARKVFEYGDGALLKYAQPDSGYQLGFAPFQQEHAKDQKVGDLKRFWHVARPGQAPNIWPSEVPDFRPAMEEMFHELDRLSLQLLAGLSLFLGYEFDALPNMVQGGETILRILHYPPLAGRAEGIRSAAHEDINLITLLVAATASGLQVKDRNGKWLAVNEEPGSIVVNVGDMLQMLTKQRFVSTTHQVINPDPGDGNDRYSAPFFIHPRREVILDPATGFTAGQYLRQRLEEIGMY